jgi:hypothetical protein
VVHTPQFNGKQEGKFTLNRPNLRCPRNGKQTRNPVRRVSPLSSLNHWTVSVVWEGDEGRSASPDTGQQGGGAS